MEASCTASIRRGWPSGSSWRRAHRPADGRQSWFSFYNDDPANIRNILDVGGGAMYDIGCYS